MLVKYNFDDMLQIANEIEVEKLGKKNKSEIKPIFIIGVPRCGSTVIEKVIASGEKNIPIGEETVVLNNFFKKQKILKKRSLDLNEIVN